MIVLCLVGIALWLVAVVAFMLSANADARTWVGFERISHPYSGRSKVLCLTVVLGAYFVVIPSAIALGDAIR